MTDLPSAIPPAEMERVLQHITAGDRSCLLCLLATSEWATPDGAAPFQEVATAYRMEYIVALAAGGRVPNRRLRRGACRSTRSDVISRRRSSRGSPLLARCWRPLGEATYRVSLS